MPRLLLTVTALVTAIAVAAGCGKDSSSSSAAAALTPAGSMVYGEATLQPEGDQKAAIDSIVEKFPGEGSAGDRIRALMEKAFAESDTDLSYEQDVEPWLGDEAAFFVSRLTADGEDGDGALMLAAEDEDKAQAAIEKAIDDGKSARHKDTPYVVEGEGAAGVVDGWAVFATEGAFKAVVDVAGGERSMEDDEDFQRTLDDAPDERLGYFYFNTPAFMKQLERSAAGAQLGQFRELFKDPFLGTLNVDEAGVRFEATVPKSLAAAFPWVAEGGDLVGDLPADSWLALAQPDLGRTLDQYVDLLGAQLGGRELLEQQFKASTGLDLEQDVTSWMGDWGLFVRGETVADLSGALIVETSDEAASRRVIDTIARYVRQAAGPGERVLPLQVSGGGEGVTLRTASLPQPIHLFQRDGKVVFAYGDSAAHDAFSPGQKLGDTAEFTHAEEALGGDYNISFYLAMGPVLELVDSAAGSSSDWREVRQYLEPLGAFVGGAREDGEKLRASFGVTVK
jgi:Protein of unknown function (DUF3352)